MSMALTLRKYLAQKGIAYDILSHPHTSSSLHTAIAASVPAEKMAKPVILSDGTDYLMAVVPADHHVKLGKLSQALDRQLSLASELEVKELFADCDLGAIPPIGQAYGLNTIVDSSLSDCSDIYLESGDHEDLLHLKGASFRKLMKHSQHASIS